MKKQPWAANNLGSYSCPRYEQPTRPQTLSVYPGTIARLQEIAKQRGLNSASHLLEEVGRSRVPIKRIIKQAQQRQEYRDRRNAQFRVSAAAKHGLRLLARREKMSISSLVAAIADGVAVLTVKTPTRSPEKEKQVLTLSLFWDSPHNLQKQAIALGCDRAEQLLEAIGLGEIEVKIPKATKTGLITTSLSITHVARDGLMAIARSHQTTISAIVRMIAASASDIPDYSLTSQKESPQESLGRSVDDGDEDKPHPAAVAERATGED